jgi:hypothetical protein
MIIIMPTVGLQGSDRKTAPVVRATAPADSLEAKPGTRKEEEMGW